MNRQQLEAGIGLADNLWERMVDAGPGRFSECVRDLEARRQRNAGVEVLRAALARLDVLSENKTAPVH